MSGVSYEEFSASPLADCFVYITSNGHQNGKETEPHTYFVKLSAEFPSCSEYMIGSEGNPDGIPEQFRILLSPYAIAVGNRGTLISLTKRSLNRMEPKFIKPFQDRDGYNRIGPNIPTPSRQVARLVAIVWHPGYNQDLEVDHIDGNRANDVADNLEWVTHRENVQRIKFRLPHHVWPMETKVLLIDTYNFCVRLVGPHEVRGIIGSPNATKLLREQRHYANGWLVLINPSLDSAVELCMRYKAMTPEILSLLYRIFGIDTDVVVENNRPVGNAE